MTSWIGSGRLLSVICLLLALGLPARAPAEHLPTVTATALEEGFSLAGKWRFRAGDGPAWASPTLDDSDWTYRLLPGVWEGDGYPESGQLAWYRLQLHLSDELLAASVRGAGLGLRLGPVMSAYELYANGQLLGGAGRLPPFAAVDYDREMLFGLPAELVGPGGELVLALRVWGGSQAMVSGWGGGPYGGEFTLGDYRRLLVSGLVSEVPEIALGTLYCGIGLFFLYLYHRNRRVGAFGWFGLLALNISLYGFLLTQWKYLLPFSFAAMKKAEFGLIYLLPAVALQMIWLLLDTRVTRLMRAYQLSFLPLALVGIIEPLADTHARTLSFYQLWCIPILLMAPLLVWQKMREGHPEARTLLVGLLIFGATCANDILLNLARLDTERLLTYGFLAVMLVMTISLANRFTLMFNRLEQEVQERTVELREANRQLAQSARIDPLTGLLNRRGFVEEAEVELQRVLRGGEDFAVVLADIDHFKQFNDRFGHACGDHVLCRVSAMLRERVRDVDRVARWGGEEFIFLLPETDAAGAAIIAAKLRDAVAENVFQYDEQRLAITMTFGIAAHQKGETLDRCIARADRALYHGKEQGRNTVTRADQPGLSLVT